MLKDQDNVKISSYNDLDECDRSFEMSCQQGCQPVKRV